MTALARRIAGALGAKLAADPAILLEVAFAWEGTPRHNIERWLQLQWAEWEGDAKQSDSEAHWLYIALRPELSGMIVALHEVAAAVWAGLKDSAAAREYVARPL